MTTYADLRIGDTFQTIRGQRTVVTIVPSRVPGCITLTHRGEDGSETTGTAPAHANVL